MPKKEVPVESLQDYLPAGTGAAVTDFLHQFKVHLTITRERKSILGDYRHRNQHANHRISVNGNLNRYSFLITLLHELAHLLTYEQFGNRAAAHGKEWKNIYGNLLRQFLGNGTFPDDIAKELSITLLDPAAGSCAEDGLLRVLRNYDEKKDVHRFVEEIRLHECFQLPDGKIFRREEKLRKRFKCVELETGKVYLFSPVYEVLEIDPAVNGN